MELKLIHPKQLIAESRDQSEVFNKTYYIDEFELRYSTLNYVDELENDILLNLIINNIKKPIKNAMGDYNSEENLTLLYIINKDKIAVVSAGEYRRELYQIYLEGIWKIKDHTEFSLL